MAGVGDHHRDRHAQLLADRLAGRLVPRVADRRLRAPEEPGAPSTTKRCGAGNRSIVCSARSTADGNGRRICSRGSRCEHSAERHGAAGHGRRHVPGTRPSARGSDRRLLESVPAAPGTHGRIAVGGPRRRSASKAVCRSTAPIPRPLLERTAQLLFDHSLFNGHPRFFGYITASPAPIGILGDFLAAAVNPNVGAWMLSPAATEIESQTVRWIAELIGYPADCGGLLVSGGNMANIVCFLAARAAKRRLERARAGRGRRRRPPAARLRLRRNPHVDPEGRRPGRPRHRVDPMDPDRRRSAHGRARRCGARSTRTSAAGDVPFMVVGTAGSVSTGAVDPLPAIAAVCREHGIWFHVDGAYGGFAAAAPEAPARLRGARRRRLGRGRSAQVAVRAARGRMRARARSGDAARRVRVSSALLPLRRDRRRTTSTTARRIRAGSARSRCGSRCARSAPPATAQMISDDIAAVARDGRRRRAGIRSCSS